MKRWAGLTVLLYAALLAGLALPLAYLGGTSPPKLFEMYSDWGFWTPIAVLALTQALLLGVPVQTARGRPVSRRTLLVPLIVSGFLVALLVAGFVLSVAFAIFGDPAMEGFFLVSVVWAVLGWIIWGILFYRYSREAPAEGFTARLLGRLMKGSILELLVAVPSHVIVRNRGDCCAPAGTLLGIAAGLAVLLGSFGPGVFFLFARRMRQLRGKIGREVPG
jgi:hypothetical protein